MKIVKFIYKSGYGGQTITLTTPIPSDTKFLGATFTVQNGYELVALGFAFYTLGNTTTLTRVYGDVTNDTRIFYKKLSFTSNSTVEISKGALNTSIMNSYMIPIKIYAIK